MDQNACAECGFTTADLAEFTRHVEHHENNGCHHADTAEDNNTSGKKLLKTGAKRLRHTQQQQGEEDDNFEANNTFAENAENSAVMLGHLADLSIFLNAATSTEQVDDAEHRQHRHHHHSHLSVASLSPQSPMDLSTHHPDSSSVDPAEDVHDGDHHQQQELKHSPTGKKGKGGGSKKTTHKCPHCTFTTYMSQHMKSHLRAHDNFVGQMYICDVCGMAFSQKANMHRHRGTHSGVKPYECRFCQKRFFRKDQMQEHSMTHIKTGDDFDCPVSGCENKFAQHSLLRQHLDHKHAISSIQQAQCKRCSLQFSNSRRLLLHYQTKHDEYYSVSSPIPDGQSPVKRLNGHLSDSCNSPSNASFSTSAVGLSPPIVKSRRSRKRARPSNNNSNGNSLATQAKKPAPMPTAAPSSAPTNNSSGSGGYNVEELLKLDCGGSRLSISASVSPAIEQQQQSTLQNPMAHPMFTMPSPSQSAGSPAGIDLFRDHLFRTCSTAALFGQFGNNQSPVAAASFEQKDKLHQHHHQQQAAVAAAAAAQLFVQSLMLQQHQQQQHQQYNHALQTTAATEANANKHLPLARSTDCRELILNGFKTAGNAKAIKREMPMPITPQGSNNEEGEASESEALLDEHDGDDANGQVNSKGQTNGRSQRADNNAPAATSSPRCANVKIEKTSGHSSTTHSPSSSSTISSSAIDGIGGNGSATSSALENSPLKMLNCKLLSASSGVLGKALMASEGLLKEALDQSGEMDCAHCGLMFTDQTLYLLHKGLHSEADPWRCNLCGQTCSDKYTFTTHMISSDHTHS